MRVKRRLLFLAAAFAVPAAIVTPGLAAATPAQASTARASTGQAGTAQAHTVQASTGRVSVTVDAMNTQFARPGDTVTVAGTISNGTGQTQHGLDVQLYASPTPFPSRDGMSFYLAHGTGIELAPAGQPFTLAGPVAPGRTAAWHASFQVGRAGMTGFGVHAITAQLQDPATGVLLSSGRTLLPFWPGSQAAGLLSPLKISWLWPLTDQPRRQVCSALTDDGLAGSLGPGGRLSALLAAGASHADARPTWIIDPALLGGVATMTRPYQVGITSNCTGAPSKPASTAAAHWLAGLRRAVPAQPAVITPYANVDMSALIRHGLAGDLARAYAAGDAVADSVLGGKFGHSVAVPPGGTADLSVLTNLATAEHVSTVVLGSSQMPPADPAEFADDAVTSVRTEAGTTMNVLLADDTLTKVLTGGDTSSGVLPKATEFAVGQRFLAETAMIAAELPGSARTVVVAPPAGWSPSQALAGDLLGETARAPWLRPTPLADLNSARDTERAITRQPLPASQPSPGELSRGYLAQVGKLGARVDAYRSMLYRTGRSYQAALTQAVAATESAAWRGGGAAGGKALIGNLNAYLTSADRKVKIIASAQVPMGGSAGQVPVSIQNGLLQQAIRVKVVASVVNTPGQSSQLTVGHFQNVWVVPPQQTRTVRLPISSAPIGSTQIQVALTTPDGTPLPVQVAKFTVQSTRYGRAILFLIGAAIGVLVLTSAYRGVRRWLRDDTRLDNQEAGVPGSVMTGTRDARHPTEAPDDLADARRRVDDT